ncbi:hypothetical protein QJ48_04290 [Paenibacillus sp. A3]|uniref:hypothetical protein n=1 Tax=Paenibacillus sp. A3 TaxID=1337054 RepID=UPI0006D547E9|nr:hypothetical protein [Paenibacillus sp. A3]KPV60746.1 hypothetical protein QJ48_04290 [Paenibacillus sp. A3]
MTRTVVPKVDKQREAASRGSGKVKVYKLSEEELAQYKVSDPKNPATPTPGKTSVPEQTTKKGKANESVPRKEATKKDHLVPETIALGKARQELAHLHEDIERLSQERDALQAERDELYWASNMQPANLHLIIPTIEGDYLPTEQRIALYATIESFERVVESSDLDVEQATAELFEIFQTFISLIHAKLQILMPGSDETTPHVVNFFRHHNMLHNQKIADRRRSSDT